MNLDIKSAFRRKQRPARPLTTDKDYVKIGKSLERMFEGGYMSHWRVYRINFFRGIFFGLGTFLGGTVMVAFVLWILGFFSELGFLRGFVETIQNTIDKT